MDVDNEKLIGSESYVGQSQVVSDIYCFLVTKTTRRGSWARGGRAESDTKTRNLLLCLSLTGRVTAPAYLSLVSVVFKMRQFALETGML